MRWRFWRRRERGPAAADPAPTGPTPAPAREAAPSAARDRDTDAEKAPTPAFSGATPRFEPVLEPGELEDLHPPSELTYGMAGLRGVVVELVSAVLAQDRAGTEALLQRLEPHEADVDMAAQIGLTVLGPRVVAAADVQPEHEALDAEDTAQVLAQGETLASRAEPLRAAMAPHCPPTLLGFAVRQALGSPDWLEPPYGEHLEGEDRDLLLAIAVLLAQTCRDGQGPPDAISAELELLLPDA